MNVINHNTVGKFDFNTRVFAQYGTGTSFADESMLFLGSANPEELMRDKFTRSKAFVPEEWLGYGVTTNHFQQGGGLNLRATQDILLLKRIIMGVFAISIKAQAGQHLMASLNLTA
jgi:hypothetical protein